MYLVFETEPREEIFSLSTNAVSGIQGLSCSAFAFVHSTFRSGLRDIYELCWYLVLCTRQVLSRFEFVQESAPDEK